ncbi:glycyl-radical enzyme activating protein [bacterium (candidate division B38) B3_B38]|nr:MAG: glycyl-radical enzyme activating protein [bacterium (candidate division B38) B3_B38]
MRKGIVFDIKRYAIHDGPGIRTAVFFKGCTLRCWWCHNPEGLALQPELVFRESRCLNGCSECIGSCARGALSRVTQQISIKREDCDLCGECARVCPAEALEVIGREMSVGEVVKEIEKELIFYDQSAGGVTFTGGEPLMQPEFLGALVEECKARGIHTAVDTCGYAPFEVIQSISDKVDLFLYDLKIMDDEKHRQYTGASNKAILDNLRRLAAQGSTAVAVRLPLIPGVNDDSDNITKIAEFIASLRSIKDISLLPYHRAGSEKYRRLHRAYRLGKTQPPSGQQVEESKTILEERGLRVKVGG